MKMLKRAFILQFLFLFIIPVAFAEITITLPEKDVYNLGDKIIPSVSIKVEQDYVGYLKLYSCDDYSEPYDKIFLEGIGVGARTELTVRELRLFKPTEKCSLKSNLESIDGGNIGSTVESKEFFVTDELNIVVDENLEVKPGEDVILLGIIRKHSGEFLSKGEAGITFKGNEEIINVSEGKFKHTIHLENDIEAGNTPILIVVTDKYGNYGDTITMFKVISVPTRIENRFEDNILTPGDALKARVILYDHTDKIINGSSINVKIFDSSEKLLAENDIESMNYLEFQTGKTQAPGAYFLLSSFENIKEQSSFAIEVVKKIAMSQEGSFVHIENVGNVDYNDETTIILEKDNKKYLINKKIELKPAEKTTIDLSKEVPQGTYDIILPKDSVSAIESSNNESGNMSEAAENVLKNVSIDDNRNVLKKTADGISTITGAAVSTAGYIASKPALAATILVLIILGTVARYSKDFIISKIKGKKKDDSSYLFRDFKFEEKK